MYLYNVLHGLYIGATLVGFTFLFIWIITRFYLKDFYPIFVKKENNKVEYKDRISKYILFSILIMVGFILNMLGFQNWI